VVESKRAQNRAHGTVRKRREDPWKLSKDAWHNVCHIQNNNFRCCSTRPWVRKGEAQLPPTPPPTYVRRIGGGYHLVRLKVSKLSLIQKQYALLIRMMYILTFVGIISHKLPDKSKLPGTLRSYARKITHMGFSKSQGPKASSDSKNRVCT